MLWGHWPERDRVAAEAEPADRFGRERFSAGLPLDFFILLLSAALMSVGGVAGWLTQSCEAVVAVANVNAGNRVMVAKMKVRRHISIFC